MNRKATVFEFTSYAFEPEEKRVIFNYTTHFTEGDPLVFTETIILPSVPTITPKYVEVIRKTLESLHIILGISYYKSYCATDVRLPYALTKSQAEFWNTVYKKGLGEFFYQNKLNPNISPEFPFSKEATETSYQLPVQEKYLVGVGGGKDSIVVAELLKSANIPFEAFKVTTGKHDQVPHTVIETIKMGHLELQRQLDEKIFQQHQFNGHVPVSAVYAFLGALASILYGYRGFVVGNEQSSNFGNITYKGLVVNHQWSKSFEFETLFNHYLKKNISPNLQYFSLLRPLYEIRIVELFAKYPQYFSRFSSCNRNFTHQEKAHQGLWCGVCPKCVFVFILLSAFLPKKDLLNIFGQNLYANEALLPLFKDVLGFGTMKPFDCVGTFEEAQTALYMARKHYAKDFVVKKIGNKTKFHKEVLLTSKETLVPDSLKFLGMKNALIMGFGKEGKITKEYLKKYYPKLKISIAESIDKKNHLKKQVNFDIAVKTPGIQKELAIIPYTTATNIFFSHVLGKNTIIGITGSKGKSTTSSLIYSILKQAGKDVVLLGNIGQPMAQALLAPIPKDQIFVLELSSYQLDDIRFSPDIAVVTNLFPEHMDFHHGLNNYYATKKNIINLQNNENYFVYNPKNTLLKKWSVNYIGNMAPYPETLPMSDEKIPLLGNHNKDNVKAAFAVARILQIPDKTTITAIENFKGLPHRLEFVGTYKGITFYDDAISTTPESTIMAINAIKNIDTIFLGGEDRGYNFSNLEKTIKRYNIRNIVLFPDSGKKMLTSIKGLNILKTKSMKEAVAFAYAHTKKGSVCLLSCASPSYSLWKNFEVKGDEFKKFVTMFAK